MNVIELHDVAVAHGARVVLDGVSLTVAEHERVAVLGPNGAGKSSLLEVIVGMAPAARGAVRVLGATPPAPGVGFLPQQVASSFLPWLSVRDNVLLPLRVRRAGAQAERTALDEVCARFDPARTLDLGARRSGFSAGQLQLAAMLRAFIAAPRVVVCDEPFSALDAGTHERVRGALLEACSRPGGPALLLVTHDDADVRVLAQRALALAPAGGDQRTCAASVLRTVQVPS